MENTGAIKKKGRNNRFISFWDFWKKRVYLQPTNLCRKDPFKQIVLNKNDL